MLCFRHKTEIDVVSVIRDADGSACDPNSDIPPTFSLCHKSASGDG